jgi:predicted enzyme related to lactoylglutathione lyase
MMVTLMITLLVIPNTAQTLNQNKEPMKRVTGIGGIFFKCKDPQAMKQWYEKHLGIPQDPYGYTFKWYEQRDSDLVGRTVWSPFPAESNYFGDPSQQVMINYRVDDIERLVELLRQEGVTIVDDIQDYEGIGKFVHILDGEGNRIELWQPIEEHDE